MAGQMYSSWPWTQWDSQPKHSLTIPQFEESTNLIDRHWPHFSSSMAASWWQLLHPQAAQAQSNRELRSTSDSSTDMMTLSRMEAAKKDQHRMKRNSKNHTLQLYAYQGYCTVVPAIGKESYASHCHPSLSILAPWSACCHCLPKIFQMS